MRRRRRFDQPRVPGHGGVEGKLQERQIPFSAGVPAPVGEVEADHVRAARGGLGEEAGRGGEGLYCWVAFTLQGTQRFTGREIEIRPTPRALTIAANGRKGPGTSWHPPGWRIPRDSGR